uniref:Uncharacterized protein n=1 Tax=Chromera velia CCMP2878 TaxID=1169474 RepID=A0A0G4GZM0_9ALVE|eukprot:Cvel_24004.t1-p1 / transcript=Cvel_24004.t1 / gene=Cvel_24004 / organism=Chromera_velia_CCMP2878 / gene_product=hypothetical protein / transcript_product=hypothetical protein / location=Cvel_scaffold2545:11294-14918(-) / protein_length=774 / sequence_SO=supercontig / SO=protein_coding / is_pseudo=false
MCCTAICVLGVNAADPTELLEFEGFKLAGLGGDKEGSFFGGKGGKCGDGKVDLATEECDEGKANGSPESFCTSECLLVPEVRCGELLINSTMALEEAQKCRTAEDVVFELDEVVDVVMPNLVIVQPGGIVAEGTGSNPPNLARSISMPNLIFARDEVDFDRGSLELLSVDFPSLLYTEELEIQNVPKIQKAHFPKLISVDSDLDLKRSPQLVDVNFNSLRVGQDTVNIEELASLERLTFPSLQTTANINIRDMPVLRTVDLPSLRQIDNALRVTNDTALQTIRAPKMALSGNLFDPEGWEFEMISGVNLDFCSLPAIEVRLLNIFTDSSGCDGGVKCVVNGPLSPACKDTEEKKSKGKDPLGVSGKEDIFSGLDLDLKGIGVGKVEGGKLADGWKGFEGLGFPGSGSGDKGKEEKEKNSCPFPVAMPKDKKAPVCGNGIVEIGEECDGDETVCDNETCEFKPEAVCNFIETLGQFVNFALNSQAALEELQKCAVIIGDVEIFSGAPSNFELPVLEAFYGNSFAAETTEIQRAFWPKAWKAFDVLEPDSEGVFPDLEEIVLPCVLQSPKIEIDGSPRFRNLNFPKAQYMRSLAIRDSCDAASPFDLIFPSLLFREAYQIDRCPGVVRIVDPVVSAQENEMSAFNNTNLEVILQPKMSLLFDSEVDVRDNPKLRLVDRSSQVFAQQIGSGAFEVFASNNAPEGLDMLFCSLYIGQAIEIVEQGNCAEDNEPPCFLKTGSSKECAKNKGAKEQEGMFGGLGLDLKFDLPKLNFDLLG